MVGRSKLRGAAGARVARLFVAIFLIGGMMAGPVVHLAPGDNEPLAAFHPADHGHDRGDPVLPDSHHDCPVCITLTTAAGPVVLATPAAVLSDASANAELTAAPRDAGTFDARRPRAPPHS